MAANSVWSVSGHSNQPESVYDAFLRNPRERDGKLYLRNRSHDWNTSQDAVVFSETFKDK